MVKYNIKICVVFRGFLWWQHWSKQ